MLRSTQLTYCRFRLTTIADGGTSASCLEFSIDAGQIDRPHPDTTSPHEPAQLL